MNILRKMCDRKFIRTHTHTTKTKMTWEKIVQIIPLNLQAPKNQIDLVCLYFSIKKKFFLLFLFIATKTKCNVRKFNRDTKILLSFWLAVQYTIHCVHYFLLIIRFSFVLSNTNQHWLNIFCANFIFTSSQYKTIQNHFSNLRFRNLFLAAPKTFEISFFSFYFSTLFMTFEVNLYANFYYENKRFVLQFSMMTIANKENLLKMI